MVLDYLDVPDLLRCARVSKRLQEMVYDDTRWVQRLRDMRCWDEAEARKASEESSRRKLDSPLQVYPQKPSGKMSRTASTAVGKGGPGTPTVAALKSSFEEPVRTRLRVGSSMDWKEVVVGGMNDSALSGEVPGARGHSPTGMNPQDSGTPLQILSTVRSIRGSARQEYGRIYSVLMPLYLEMVRSGTSSQPAVFRRYQTPEEQAKILAQLRLFAKADVGAGARRREEALTDVLDVFETAALREFEQSVQSRPGARTNDLLGIAGSKLAILG